MHLYWAPGEIQIKSKALKINILSAFLCSTVNLLNWSGSFLSSSPYFLSSSGYFLSWSAYFLNRSSHLLSWSACFFDTMRYFLPALLNLRCGSLILHEKLLRELNFCFWLSSKAVELHNKKQNWNETNSIFSNGAGKCTGNFVQQRRK